MAQLVQIAKKKHTEFEELLIRYTFSLSIDTDWSIALLYTELEVFKEFIVKDQCSVNKLTRSAAR